MATNTRIKSFIQDGTDHDDLIGVSVAEVAAVLASDPKLALILLHNEDRARDCNRRGWKLRHFRVHIVAAIDHVVAQGISDRILDEYGAAVARLYAASLLDWNGGQSGDWLLAGDIPARERRAVVAGFATGKFDAAQGIQPHRIVRLLLSRHAAQLQEESSGDWLKDQIASAVRNAMVLLHPGGQLGIHSQIRACVVMAVASLEGRDDEDNDSAARKVEGEIIAACGFDRNSFEQMREELRGESGAPTLFATFDREPDVDALSRLRPFRAAADRLRVSVTAEEIRFRTRIESEYAQQTDPWLAWMYRSALGSGPHSATALAVMRRLGSDRNRRASVLPAMLAPLAASVEARAIFTSEMQSAGANLGVEVFTAMFGAIELSLDVQATREFEQTPLMPWYRQMRELYIRDALEFRTGVASRDLNAIVVSTFGKPPVPTALSGLAPKIQQIIDADERGAAFECGRGWFYELVKYCATKMSDESAWDGGRGALAADDRRFLADIVTASKPGASDSRRSAWFKVAMEPAREFRLAEAATQVGCLAPADFQKFVQRVSDALIGDQSLSTADRERVTPLVRACAECVSGVSSAAAPHWRTLDAFRRIDVREVLQSMERSRVDLPRSFCDSSMWGKRAIVCWSVAAILVFGALAATFVEGAPDGPIATGGPLAANVRGRPRVMELSGAQVVGAPWVRFADSAVDSNGKWARLVTQREFRRMVPGTPGPETSVTDDPAQISAMMAREYLERLEWEMKSFPDGVRWPDTPGGAPRSAPLLRIRPLRTSELSTALRSLGGNAGKCNDVWQDARLSEKSAPPLDPFETHPLIVILQERGSGE